MVGAESIHYCLGAGHLTSHQNALAVQAGDVLLMPRGTRYQLTAASRRLRIRNRALAHNLPVDRHAGHVIHAACQWANQHQFRLPFSAASQRHLVPALDACFGATSLLEKKSAFFNVVAQLERLVPPLDQLPRHTGQAAVMKRLLDHVTTYSHEVISVSDALAITGLSRSHFHVAFRQATGTTFQRYLTSLRIGEACRLLRHTQRSILDIAYSCGFGSPSRFFSAFKQVTGTSPEKFRNQREPSA
jgi:AraC-like DNA-binding protein